MTEYVAECKELESLTGTVYYVPIARKEEIVRCRDCRYYREHKFFQSTLGMGLGTDISDVCMFFSDGVKVEPDGFCWKGERKVDE